MCAIATTVYQALAHPTRRKILRLLKSGPKTAGDLANEFDNAWPTISRHLQTLKACDLISVERHSTSLLYRANTSILEGAIAELIELMGSSSDEE